MNKPVSLLSAGFAFVALTALQFSSAETQPNHYESSPQLSLQPSSAAQSVRITTLSATDTSVLSQPQRWVF
ncbi:hypothetical protein CXK91_13485 [Stutzerimonas stutzeri]|uniref:Uncharacterized protein n=1 Tax=Stutzerimonas stutzeri TaxID=316 RepID=A0A2S4ALJ6_STUST|nr:hypothetical protein CXK91_13485 [Stutzerimonas stutzeri]